jgi:hypothetical protein
MAFGRKKDREADLAAAGFITPDSSSNKESTRTTSYPLDQTGVATKGLAKTTSYKSSAQYNARGYETIN